MLKLILDGGFTFKCHVIDDGTIHFYETFDHSIYMLV